MNDSRNRPTKAGPPKRVDGFSPRQRSQFPVMGSTIASYGHNQPSPLETEPKPKKHHHIFKRSFISLIVLVLLAAGLFAGKSIYELHKAFGGSIFSLFTSSKLNGESTGHVNILLAGMAGQNSGQTGGVNLTDSIMVVSLNVNNNSGWMLSIPRDMITHIPNHGYQKINAVYEDEGINGLTSLVSKDLDIPINYYAVIDYNAFKQAVDAVGGVKIDIQSSDPRGLYDAYTHLDLPNGWVELNGTQALDLARARGDDVAGDVSYGFPNSDFDRTTHQRQILEALKTKVATTSVLANPIKLSNLFSALSDNVKTDFTLGNARRLYDLSKKIPDSKIKSLSLNNANGHDLLTSYDLWSVGSGLIPAAGINNYSAIQSFVAQQN